jgi:hypothetical protein
MERILVPFLVFFNARPNIGPLSSLLIVSKGVPFILNSSIVGSLLLSFGSLILALLSYKSKSLILIKLSLLSLIYLAIITAR